MLKKVDLHTDLIGRLCRLTDLGVLLEKEYEELWNIGNYRKAEFLHAYHAAGKYQLLLMFIDVPPVTRHGHTWYCVKEIGRGVGGDWHWFTLDQLMLCEG